MQSKRPSVTFQWLLGGMATVLSVGTIGVSGPMEDEVSALIPAADLVAEVHEYVDSLTADLADEAKYNSAKDAIKRDANVLVALGQVLAMSTTENELSPSASSIVAAAKELAAAKDYAAASLAFDGVQAAAGGEAVGGATEIKWEKLASLGQLMNEVTLVNSSIRRNMRRIERNADATARDAVLLAAIAQVTIFDTHEVKDPAKISEWEAMCREMRDSAADLAAQIKAMNKSGATAALTRMNKSCEDCHAVFHPTDM